MEREAIKQYADWLQTNTNEIVAQKIKFDAEQVYRLIDSLHVFDQSVTSFLTMTQETYYRTISDHKLTLQGERDAMNKLQDRVLVNHVDGALAAGEIHFEYNHEDSYAEGYSPRKDLQIIAYSFKVLGAVVAISNTELVRQHLSKDAAISIALAADALTHWQEA
ncbi:hypothetical protein [Lapidilactobacillus luobeiensis]|uniref:hypothetical protein n=1 Tax=Lapidilactobacillus luobeiensis TaxID=2950371 RepID=UPI0021C40BDE|nr:hypothetical protein [Lapidilactobacillus luobeiensis]